MVSRSGVPILKVNMVVVFLSLHKNMMWVFIRIAPVRHEVSTHNECFMEK